MPILNYTTGIHPQKTAYEITKILVKLGAQDIGLRYEGERQVGMAFSVRCDREVYAYQLPVRIDAVYDVLVKQGVPKARRTREQAERTAWRITKNWIEVQAAIVETQMVRLEEVMLPYMITNDGGTVFDRWQITKQLTAGTSA